MERMTSKEFNLKYPKFFKKDKKASDRKLLALWSEIVKLRAKGICEYPGCGRKEYLNAHHIFSRSKRSVRYDPDNGLCLCPAHHTLSENSAHKDPFFKETMIESGVRTKQFYDKLRIRAMTPAKPDLKLIEIYLKSELKKCSKK